VETDLHLSADGELVLMHDHTLDRTTDGRGPVREKTLAEIRRLDASAWKGEGFRGQRVPTFVEFLEWMLPHGEIQLCIELKDYPGTPEDNRWAFAAADQALALVDSFGVSERCIFNSWSARVLEHIARQHGRAIRLEGYHPFFLMGERSREPYDYLSSVCLFALRENESGRLRPWHEAVAEKAHFDEAIRHGVEPWVYYREEREDLYRRAISHGAKVITANDPAKALHLLQMIAS